MTTLALVGLRWSQWLAVFGAVVLLGTGVITVSSHARARILAFVQPQKYPDESFQMRLAMQAERYGGITGMAEGKERMKRILPEADSDFIFAIYAQDTGLIGSLALLTAFCVLTWRGVRITLQARDRLGQLVAGGVTALLTWQTLINLGVATGSLPTTGVPLPFVSSGSTALVIFMACIGILLSVSQSGRLEAK
jgi:cell division protein FtsW